MSNPKVTIGIPVYNGARDIEACIACLLEGTFQNIEILISDNASTDDTATIVKKIMRADTRVKLFRQNENIGPVANFRFIAEQANSPLFMWRAHDDISSPDYIATLVETLTANDQAVLAAPRVITRKAKGDRIRPFPVAGAPHGWASMNKATAGWMYGLFRTAYVQPAIGRVLDNYAHIHAWDMLMLLDALLNGGIVGCNETTFVHNLDRPKDNGNKPAASVHRQRARDFSKAAHVLADQSNLTGGRRLAFNLMLSIYIEKRVARLRHRF